ncbi:hypothetical protein ACFVS2_28230 [Brevibacillus sp. NPDC058079]|uniref:hypothetical protein n=1 Tax=Brevibacillus sp. NPDC058079 TaxID=3346330 RepID=UPI0036E3B8B5
MTTLYEQTVTPLLPVDPDAMANMFVVIYDSVRQGFAITVIWFQECIRRKWGVVKDINQDEHMIKLVQVDGIWWVPIAKLLMVERI